MHVFIISIQSSSSKTTKSVNISVLFLACCLIISKQKLWKVLTLTLFPSAPTICSTLSFISLQALFVKVIHNISSPGAFLVSIILATLLAKVSVLPVPAEAKSIIFSFNSLITVSCSLFSATKNTSPKNIYYI